MKTYEKLLIRNPEKLHQNCSSQERRAHIIDFNAINAESLQLICEPPGYQVSQTHIEDAVNLRPKLLQYLS